MLPEVGDTGESLKLGGQRAIMAWRCSPRLLPSAVLGIDVRNGILYDVPTDKRLRHVHMSIKTTNTIAGTGFNACNLTATICLIICERDLVRWSKPASSCIITPWPEAFGDKL